MIFFFTEIHQNLGQYFLHFKNIVEHWNLLNPRKHSDVLNLFLGFWNVIIVYYCISKQLKEKSYLVHRICLAMFLKDCS